MSTPHKSYRTPPMTASPPIHHGRPLPLASSGSGSTAASRSASQCLGCGPWPNYEFPSKWELNDDFMCVHFIPRTSNQHTWRSQCTFWSEAIALYAQQLLWQCPHAWNRLTFAAKDVVAAYTRKNRLRPMCIADVLRFMKHCEHSIVFADFIHDQYDSDSGVIAAAAAQYNTSHAHATPSTSTAQTVSSSSSFLSSISGVSSMVTSMFGYLLPSTADSDDDDDDEEDDDYDGAYNEMKHGVTDDRKCVFVPILEQLCEKLCRLHFYRQSFTKQLSQLLEIALIVCDEKRDAFIIAGFAFERVCMDVLRLTASDVCALKQWLIGTHRVSLFYMHDGDDDNNTQMRWTTTTLASATTDEERAFVLKNEMLFFDASSRDAKEKHRRVSAEEWSKMQLLSIQMTMKHLRLQRTENEHVLHTLKHELLHKLKHTPSEQRSAFVHQNRSLIERKKLLANRISKLDGSLYNLESTLHSMEDVSLNKMVLLEMRNADDMLKQALQTAPTVDEIERIQSGLQHSMAMNRELGEALARPMETDEFDEEEEEELLHEYDDLVMAEVQSQLPDVPCHDVVVVGNDKETTQVQGNNDANETQPKIDSVEEKVLLKQQ